MINRETWSEIGALSSAGTVVATIFCCLPFATGIIGASVAAFGARFASYQPYLTAASVALLAYSFFEAYRPDPTCATDQCDIPRSVRRRRIMVWAVALLVTMSLTASWWADRVIFWTL
jgi:hypothetical protein